MVKETRGKEKDREERDEEVVKVYDGNNAVRKRHFKVVAVRRDATLQQLLVAALRAYHVTRDSCEYTAEHTSRVPQSPEA